MLKSVMLYLILKIIIIVVLRCRIKRIVDFVKFVFINKFINVDYGEFEYFCIQNINVNCKLCFGDVVFFDWFYWGYLIFCFCIQILQKVKKKLVDMNLYW